MNLNDILTAKNCDGNLNDCLLTSITNTFLIDPLENDNARSIHPYLDTLNDCTRAGAKMDRLEESINNNIGIVANNAITVSQISPKLLPICARTKQNGLSHCNVTMDDFELIELEDLDLDSEDSWLYRPKELSLSPSTYDWVRGEFDLWEDKISDSSLLKTLNALAPGKGGRSRNTRTLTRPKKSLLSNNISRCSPPSSTSAPQKVNSRTYNKNQLMEVVARIQQIDVPAVIRRNGGEGMSDGRWLMEGEGGSRSLEESFQESGQHKVVDVSDVQMLAKLQEDNLRKSFSSSTQRPARSELNKSTGHLLDNLGQGSPLHRSAHSSPGRTYELSELRKSRNSLTLSFSSCSPSESVTDITEPLSKKSSGPSEVRQRSLPNLSKSNRPETHPSDDQSHSQRDTTPPSDESSDAIPTHVAQPVRQSGLKKPSTRVTAPTSKQPQETTSSLKTSIPSAPRSGIPAPKVFSSIQRSQPGSKLRQPSKLGTVKRMLTTPTQIDSSWREGCF